MGAATNCWSTNFTHQGYPTAIRGMPDSNLHNKGYYGVDTEYSWSQARMPPQSHAFCDLRAGTARPASQSGKCLSCHTFLANNFVLTLRGPHCIACYNQGQINVLQEFCAIKHMEVNLEKIVIVILNRPRSQPSSSGIWYLGQQVALSTQYKYLGMSLFSTKKLHEAKLFRLQQATKASFHIHSRGLSRHIYHMKPLVKFLTACIRPVLTYAVEIWGPGCPVTGWEKLEPLQNRYLKRKLKLPDSTSTPLLLAETGLHPLEIVSLQQTMDFYQQVHAMPDDRLPKQALLMNHADALRTTDTWVYQLRLWLQRWQPHHHSMLAESRNNIFQSYIRHEWDMPLTPLPPEQRRYLGFIRPRLLQDQWQMQSYMEAEIPHRQMQAIVQLRPSHNTSSDQSSQTLCEPRIQILQAL